MKMYKYTLASHPYYVVLKQSASKDFLYAAVVYGHDGAPNSVRMTSKSLNECREYVEKYGGLVAQGSCLAVDRLICTEQ